MANRAIEVGSGVSGVVPPPPSPAGDVVEVAEDVRCASNVVCPRLLDEGTMRNPELGMVIVFEYEPVWNVSVIWVGVAVTWEPVLVELVGGLKVAVTFETSLPVTVSFSVPEMSIGVALGLGAWPLTFLTRNVTSNGVLS